MTSLSLDLRSYPDEVSAHDHPYHQVILALEGALEMEIGTSGGRCAEGRVDQARGALVPAGTLHAFSGIGRNRFVTLDIGSDSRAAPSRLLASGSPFFAVPRAVEHLLHYVESRHGLTAEAEHVAPLLAAALAEPQAGQEMPDPVLRAIGFLRGAYRRPITCADAARAAGLSTARLHALFAQWVGMGPGHYLSALRLDHARDRLARGAEPIAEIALDAGFGDQSAFTRAFRRRFGRSPAAYRRALENRHTSQ
ncbi:MAG TPA: AraC family transcriptional regulator [Candidatus Cybelea sp.]|nr:AraC family transcriptional regulator [Candidatus Cybelea sp.]